MPKSTSGRALKQARKQLNITFKTIEASDTEDSIESDDSAELSHIPLKNNLVPQISELSISEPTKMDQALTEMMEQLRHMNDNIANLNQRQENQELALQALAQPSPQVEQPELQVPTQRVEDFFRIPDPIKSLPHFEGNRKQLHAWLTTAEETLDYFKAAVSPQLFRMYVTAVTNKIEGRAKDILCLAGNPQDFDTIKSTLINALGDRQELSTYKCQLWQHKMTDGMNIHKYYQKSKELIQNIKTLAKQNATYKANWLAINLFIDEDGLAAFISGLRGTYFGHVQAARPKDIEDAYAFLCKFKSQEITANALPEKHNKSFNRHENTPKGDPRNYQKNQFQPLPQGETSKSFPPKINQTTPMDIDPSQRSRLTLNRKLINNTEVDPEDSSEEEENEDVFEGNVNFCITTPHANPK